MHIHLQDGARPRKTTVPGQVAKRFESAANTTLNELIARGVLVKEPGVTEWCSPAVWVPKGDNVRVRLCTDYRELNKMVKRPVHPFPSTREILQAIPVTAQILRKVGRSTRILPTGIRRGKLEAHDIPIAARKIQIH